MYKAVCKFRDLEDGHLYEADDRFPHDGRTISEQRIEALRTGHNLACKVLITEVEEVIEEAPKTRRNAKKQAKK